MGTAKVVLAVMVAAVKFLVRPWLAGRARALDEWSTCADPRARRSAREEARTRKRVEMPRLEEMALRVGAHPEHPSDLVLRRPEPMQLNRLSRNARGSGAPRWASGHAAFTSGPACGGGDAPPADTRASADELGRRAPRAPPTPSSTSCASSRCRRDRIITPDPGHSSAYQDPSPP